MKNLSLYTESAGLELTLFATVSCIVLEALTMFIGADFGFASTNCIILDYATTMYNSNFTSANSSPPLWATLANETTAYYLIWA